MASGEPFNPDALTCAHMSLPFGTRLEVRRIDRPELSVTVEVTDRGPARWTGRRLDLSREAFSRLGNTDRGVMQVEFKKL